MALKAAIADLDALYKACPSDKRLVACSEQTKELTVKELQDIQKSINKPNEKQQTQERTVKRKPIGDCGKERRAISARRQNARRGVERKTRQIIIMLVTFYGGGVFLDIPR